MIHTLLICLPHWNIRFYSNDSIIFLFAITYTIHRMAYLIIKFKINKNEIVVANNRKTKKQKSINTVAF